MTASETSPLVREIEKGTSFETWQLTQQAGTSGAMRLDWSRTGAVRILVVGHGHAEFAPPALKRFDLTMRSLGKLAVLADFWDMPTYDSGLRVELTKWGTTPERRGKFEIHVLSRSKLVTMGVTVASLALAGLTSYSARMDFDRFAQKQGLPINPPIPR